MLVDLAGSERLKLSGSDREETATINASLFSLGKVINALAERTNNPAVHVPYRDTLLTKLLMEGLGGEALTLLIACCSPSDLHVEETINTLLYAQKAKGVVIASPTRIKGEKTEVSLLKQEIKNLRRQNSDLRRQLRGDTAEAAASRQLPVETSRWDGFYPWSSSEFEERRNNGIWREGDWMTGMKTSLGRGGDVLEEIAALKTKLGRLESKFGCSDEDRVGYRSRRRLQVNDTSIEAGLDWKDSDYVNNDIRNETWPETWT